MGDDARHGIAAAVVVVEHLGEEAPDGGDGGEHSVSILDAMLIESVEDVLFAQAVGKRQSMVVRKASANLLQGDHRGSHMSRMEVVRTQESPRPSPVHKKLTRAGSASYVYYTW